MPARHDQHDPPARPQPRRQVRPEPLPQPVTAGCVVGLRLRLHRIIDEQQIGPPPGHRAANAGSVILAAAVRREPFRRRAPLQPVAQPRGVRLDQRLHAPAEMTGQPARMGGGDHRTVRMLREPPGREQHRGIGALRRPGRQQQHQPVDLAPRDTLQPLDEQKMMRGRHLVVRRQGQFRPVPQPATHAKAKLPLLQRPNLSGRPEPRARRLPRTLHRAPRHPTPKAHPATSAMSALDADTERQSWQDRPRHRGHLRSTCDALSAAARQGATELRSRTSLDRSNPPPDILRKTIFDPPFRKRLIVDSNRTPDCCRAIRLPQEPETYPVSRSLLSATYFEQRWMLAHRGSQK